MVIRVSDIPEEGLQLDGPGALAHPFQDGAWALTGLSLRLDKEGDVVIVHGRIEARVPQTCGRCLEPYDLVVAPTVEARFVPRGAARREEKELGADDLDTDTYDHDVLDLAAVVEGETTLALPMKALCRPDCRGLCPVCGGNRNASPCTCGDSPPDPRWAPLRGLAQKLST